MHRRLAVLTATLWAFVATGMIGATQKVDLTDKPAVQDALVNFGHPVHPQPAAPNNHILDPNDVTILKGGTVTFTMHGTGHGVAIYLVSKNTTHQPRAFHQRLDVRFRECQVAAAQHPLPEGNPTCL